MMTAKLMLVVVSALAIQTVVSTSTLSAHPNRLMARPPVPPVCPPFTVANNTAVEPVDGVNGTNIRNTNGGLAGCCEACAKAGPKDCAAFFTGPDFKLCVLYPAGGVRGSRSSEGHTAAFRGRIPPPSPDQPHFPGGSLDQKLVVLTQMEADEFGAKCLDGSPPAIYYSPARGTENQNNWVLFFKGGGWCYNEQSCASRSTSSLGSSTHLPENISDTWDKSSGPLHPNATLNPTFANYHRAVLWYCDGASSAGYKEYPVISSIKPGGPNVTLWFRGKANLDAQLAKLKKDYGLSSAEQVLLSGCSAGGMSTYLHADYVKDQIYSPSLKKYKAAGLSGFFLDHLTASGEPFIRDNYDYMFKMQNMSGGVNKNCIKASSTGDFSCAFPQQNYGFTESPFFVMNSMLDAWQMGNDLEIGCSKPSNCNATQITDMDHYQHDFYATISNYSTFHKPGNGAFLYNCFLHCGEIDDQGFNQITVKGGSTQQTTLMERALSNWWNSDNDAANMHTYVEHCTLIGPSSCNPTCPSGTFQSIAD